jgi:hypothetical protein
MKPAHKFRLLKSCNLERRNAERSEAFAQSKDPLFAPDTAGIFLEIENRAATDLVKGFAGHTG